MLHKGSLLNRAKKPELLGKAPPAPRPFQPQGWGSGSSQEVALQPLGSQASQEGSSRLQAKWQSCLCVRVYVC